MTEHSTVRERMADTAHTVAAAPSVLRNRDFLLLWLAHVFSQIAQNALILGVLVLVQRLTQSPTHLSLATFSLVLPSVLFSLVAGIVVDRLNKKTVLVAANVLRTAASLLFLLLDRSLGVVYLVSFLFSSVGQFFSPAEASAIPLLVRTEQLVTANALFNLTLSASQLLGLVIVAPLMIKVAGIGGLFVLLAVLFALAAICVAFLPPDRRPLANLSRSEGEALRSVWQELREGWRILRADKLASLAMLNLTLMASLAPLLAVLGPVFAVSVIRAGAEDVVYLFAPAGVGMLVATAALGRVVKRIGKLRLIALGLVAMGITLALLAAAKTGGGFLLYNVIGLVLDTRHIAFELIPVVMALSFALGFEFVCISIPAQTILHERCPDNFRSRVIGVQFTLSGAGSLLPLLGAGGFSDLFGVNKTMFLLGTIVLAIGVATWRYLGTLAANRA